MKCAERAATNDESGISLLEVTISSVLMFVGLLGLAGVFAHGVRSNVYAQSQSTATAAAEQRIEQLEQQGYSYLVTNSANIDTALPVSSLPGDANNNFTAATTITMYDAVGNVTNSAGSCVRVEVKVTVTPVGRAQGAVTLVKHISKVS